MNRELHPRDPAPPRGRTRVAGILVLLGGGLLTASSWLDLGTAEGQGYREVLAASDTFEGGAFLAAGLGFIVAGIVVWGPPVDRHSRVVGLGAMLGGGASLWLAVTAALTVGREGGRLGEGFVVAPAPGLYLALMGGGLALVGGGLALFAPRERPVAAERDLGVPDRRDPWAPPSPADETRGWERGRPEAPQEAERRLPDDHGRSPTDTGRPRSERPGDSPPAEPPWPEEEPGSERGP